MTFTVSKYLSVFLFTLFLVLSAKAVFVYDDWKPITPEEVSMKTPKVEADADAEAIFWEVRIDDSSDSSLSQQHYVRVKIFTERGREKYSKFDIPFTKGIKIKDIAARVIKADGSIVEINPKDIFEREIIKVDKVKIKAKSFAVPNIEPGVIVEYRYKEVQQDEGAVGMELSFQKDIPIQTLSYYYKTYGKREPIYQAYNFTDTKFVKDQKDFYLAQRKNIPAFREEPRMPPEDSVRPWILIQNFGFRVTDANAFSVSYVIKDPTNPRMYWSAVAQQNMSITKFMNKPNKDIAKVATEVTDGATTDDEKLRKLYEFVQTQIRNTSFDSSLTDEQRKKLPKNNELKDVLKNKSASSQFIDLIFGAMARSLGYETAVVFAANRKKMVFDPKMTNEAFLHPACIAVLINNQWKYFNPGVKYLSFGSLVWYEQSVWALVVGEKTYNWEELPILPADKSLSKRSGKFKLSEDGTLEGDVQIEFSGNTGIANRLDLFDETSDKQMEMVKNEAKINLSTADISDISIENIDDVNKPLIYKYKVSIPNYAQKTGKRLFLQPSFFEYGEKPLFSSSTRKFDVEFPYPWSEKDDIEIELPKGFSLDNADSPAGVADPQKIGLLEVTMGIDKAKGILVYRRNFHFGGGGNIVFPLASYQTLKNMFDAFNKADSHTITLKQD